jgi:hypothetical protein
VIKKAYITPTSWQNGIANVYDALGRPGIFRNDRFWLAGDHRVEPELYEKPEVKKLMQSSKRAQKEFKMTEFQGFNVSIYIIRKGDVISDFVF